MREEGCCVLMGWWVAFWLVVYEAAVAVGAGAVGAIVPAGEVVVELGGDVPVLAAVDLVALGAVEGCPEGVQVVERPGGGLMEGVEQGCGVFGGDCLGNLAYEARLDENGRIYGNGGGRLAANSAEVCFDGEPSLDSDGVNVMGLVGI